ncbi:MAG: hypothetical protein JSR61_01270 [Proteobacteria bacterium]|nr:hypothetical protein [Pseudomonadota bacterium]
MHWTDKIFQEKTFSSVYFKSRKVCSSRVNFNTAMFAFLFVAAYLGANFHFGMGWISFPSVIVTIRAIGEVGLTVTTQLLGFLIAGFAIFASITKPEIFIMLAKLPHTEGGITRLQFIFFNFMFAFIHFILFLAASVFIKIILPPNGPFSGLLQMFSSACPMVLSVLAGLLLCALAAWLVFILMLLKSFIWNMYQSILLTIAADGKLREDTAKRSATDT